MQPDVIAAFAALGLTVVGGFSGVVYRQARTDLKVDTMWDVYTRRAEVEVVKKGLGKRNSPLMIFQKAAAIFPEAFANDLRASYAAKRWSRLSQPDLLLSIEREYGVRMMDEVCIPHDFTNGGCLIIAAAIARGDLAPANQRP